MADFEFFAPCPRGVERLLGDELRALRCERVRPVQSGVNFAGGLGSAYRVLLWSRLASRVLLTLARVDASDADTLYEAVRALPWEAHVAAEGTIAVDASGMNDALRNTQFTAVRVKDAVCDRFVDRSGVRPSVDVRDPDLRINVAIRQTRATISLDLSGDALHRRGYREAGVQVAAPMKETLAAAVLAFAGWPGIARAGGAFLDPLCGSGTLAIEAALMAGDVAPGILRARWGFDRWLGHDADAWDALLAEADDRAEAGRSAMVPIQASDADPAAVAIARACAKRAGLEGLIDFSVRSLADLDAVPAASAPGLIATNPPYGERIEAQSGLPALYAELTERARAVCPGWTLAVITPDAGLTRGLKLSAERTLELYNGRILSPVSVFAVPDAHAAEAAGAHPMPAAVAGRADAEAFANRLRKMARHNEKWARRTGVSCYRVYDADLPDYAVAIDVYNGAGPDAGRRWVHIAEYAPPPGIEADRAAWRLDDVLAVVPVVLDVAPQDVFLKVRERKRGSAQYEVVARSGVRGTIEEAGQRFEVNLSDYLDTGIFLDHRLTRARLREIAAGTRFLNLFAYTGTASVAAAAGGAAETTTVDLSATYLEWARRNLQANGFAGDRHRLVRADVTEWVREQAAGEARYDLIFCDPPTFSNSKRMDGTWDVQRDHVALIADIAALLADGGLLVFSCNRRGFRLDVPALEVAGLAVRDISASTIPRDFERRPNIHVAFEIRRS